MFVSTLSITAMRYCFSLTLTQMVKMPAKNVSAAKDPFTCPNQNGYSARYADIASKEYTLVGQLMRLISGYFKQHILLQTFNKFQTNEKYDWSNELQGMILSSFYLGYSISHFPGGLIADRIGGKMVFATALVSTVIFTLLIPMAVHFGGASALIGIRLAMGLFQGGIFPAINTILSAWIPRNERSRMVSLVFCGYPVSFIFFIEILNEPIHFHTMLSGSVQFIVRQKENAANFFTQWQSMEACSKNKIHSNSSSI